MAPHTKQDIRTQDTSGSQAPHWRAQIVEFHEQLVRERGEGWGAFWGSEASQRGRYDLFFAELPLAGSDVLEVGCGFGDFLHIAREKQARPRRYLGIDLSPQIIATAQRLHPDASFGVLDILGSDPPFVPDFVIASGIMAVDLPDYEAYVLAVLRRFHAIARRGFALNFLSTRSERPDGRSRYVEPGWLLTLFQRHVDWRCRLLHDYRANDFTLIHQRPDTP